MKKNTRRSFTPEFKARVALEAARGAKTINEIAADNDLHPIQVTKWKKELLDGAFCVFECGLECWFERYNHWRPRDFHDGIPPWGVYRPGSKGQAA